MISVYVHSQLQQSKGVLEGAQADHLDSTCSPSWIRCIKAALNPPADKSQSQPREWFLFLFVIPWKQEVKSALVETVNYSPMWSLLYPLIRILPLWVSGPWEPRDTGMEITKSQWLSGVVCSDVEVGRFALEGKFMLVKPWIASISATLTTLIFQACQFREGQYWKLINASWFYFTAWLSRFVNGWYKNLHASCPLPYVHQHAFMIGFLPSNPFPSRSLTRLTAIQGYGYILTMGHISFYKVDEQVYHSALSIENVFFLLAFKDTLNVPTMQLLLFPTH